MTNTIKKIIKNIHAITIHTNRVSTISSMLIKNIPSDIKSILDIGCGDGQISAKIQKERTEITYTGIDVLERPKCEIIYQSFDGLNIPFEAKTFDAIQLIDVLHHVENISDVLNNALKYAKKYVIIKDHIFENKIDFQTLKFMDWIGNAPHGVRVIYNFQNEKSWDEIFSNYSLEKYFYSKKINLYPWFANWIFGRKLHFIVILEIKNYK
jgi:ubiquinone/menaquinone biosynthesis C-methylase UbiE